MVYRDASTSEVLTAEQVASRAQQQGKSGAVLASELGVIVEAE